VKETLKERFLGSALRNVDLMRLMHICGTEAQKVRLISVDRSCRTARVVCGDPGSHPAVRCAAAAPLMKMTVTNVQRTGHLTRSRAACWAEPGGNPRPRSGETKLDSLVETPFSVKSPPLALSPGPFFLAIRGFYG
jgi:hypothetical protein